MTTWRLSTPLKDEDIAKVRVGDIIYLTGHVSTGRDDVHMRVVLDHKPLPVGDMRGGALMHAGPIVRLVSGEGETGKYEMVAIGPTTSMRMEKFEAEFIAATGCKLIIGKGGMGPKTVQACKEHHVLQTIFPAGCAVLGALTIEEIESVGWLDLGMPEAVWHCRVKDFGPLIVSIDGEGNSMFDVNRPKFQERNDKATAEICKQVHFMH